MIGYEITPAHSADAEEIGKIRAANWKEQYADRPGVTEDWMNEQIDRIAGTKGTDDRARWIEVSNQPGAANYWRVVRHVGEDAVNSVVGYLEARRHDDGTQELRSLHFAKEHRGSGLGADLMDEFHTSDWIDPTKRVTLDVAADNDGGQRFYERDPHNYQLTGHEFNYGPIPMRQMERPPQTAEDQLPASE
jgi:ribosomal protein S18 acetylase RimI-like enzyme